MSDKEDRIMLCECVVCGHKWASRKGYPFACPNIVCRTSHWDGSVVYARALPKKIAERFSSKST